MAEFYFLFFVLFVVVLCDGDGGDAAAAAAVDNDNAAVVVADAVVGSYIFLWIGDCTVFKAFRFYLHHLQQKPNDNSNKKKLNRNFCSKRVVLSCQCKNQHNMYHKKWEKAKSGSMFLLTFDCILYDRLRAK